MILQRLTKDVWDVLAVVEVHGDGPCCPVVDFLDERAKQTHGQVVGMYDLIDRFGESGREKLSSEHCHRVSRDNEPAVWQFRKGRLRVLWFYASPGKVIVCSHGFLKDSEETPRRQVLQVLGVMERYAEAAARGGLEVLEV